MHRSWEEGAGREQVRRGGSAGREGGASSEGRQGSSRDQGQERKREKLGLGAGQGQGGTRRGGDLGRSREGGSNAPSLLLPSVLAVSPFLLSSASSPATPSLSCSLPPAAPFSAPRSVFSPLALRLFFAPLPLLCLLLPLSLSPFASSIVATLSTLHHRYLRQPYPRPTIIRSRSTAPRSTLFGYGFLMRGHGNEVLHMAYSEGWVRDT